MKLLPVDRKLKFNREFYDIDGRIGIIEQWRNEEFGITVTQRFTTPRNPIPAEAWMTVDGLDREFDSIVEANAAIAVALGLPIEAPA
jgi:hypothetical protein